MKKSFFKFLTVGFLSFIILSDVSGQDAPAASASALYNEGVAALKEKNYKSGYQLLDSAYVLANKDNNAEVSGLAKKNLIFAAYNYGNDLIKNKDTKGAIAVFERGLAVDPASGIMHQGIGKAKEEMGDAEGAVKSYVTSLNGAKEEKDDKKISDAQARVKNLLVKQLQSKAYAKVIKIGTEYLAVDNNPDITYLVGKAYADKGENANGIKYMLQTVDLSNKAGAKVEDKVYYALGLAYDATKDGKNATKYLSMVSDPKYKASVDAIIAKYKAAKK